VAVGELFESRRVERGEREDWAVDTWAAVGAEVAAALRISLGLAGSYLHYALAMRARPAVAAAFRAGDIDYRLFQTIVYRTDLITDPQVAERVDAQIAARACRWPSMTRGRLAAAIDRIVAAADPDAVRRPKDRVTGREVSIWGFQDGTAELGGRLAATDATALDQRLDAMAATVCAADPRTKDQRRADALGALAAGADRLACRCDNPGCAAGARRSGPVIIHVVADQATVDGRADTPAAVLGADFLLPAAVVAELATSARLVPLAPPVDPEPRYLPSAVLAAFVRARDLTCRAPGCDRPATVCDLDHTIPYGDGGPTHAANIKALCRLHHLLKTFWGWQDTQLPDGTVIWQLPDNQTYITTPGSALLFPNLEAPAGITPTLQPTARCANKTARMPLRDTTRTQNRAARITAERRHNHQARTTPQTSRATEQFTPNGPPPPDDDPPPF
jgi:Domain of unknown function (DUF222)